MQIQQHKIQEKQAPTYQHNHYPDAQGRFGAYGGQFVPESLMSALADLESAYKETQQDEAFQTELKKQLRSFVGRPTSLHYVPRFSQLVAPDVKIYLKREDLAHTGAHKIKRERGNTEWPAPPCAPCWGWTVWCTWERST